MIRRCPLTAELLPRLVAALAAQRAGERGRLFDITDWEDDDRRLIGEVLGEGEVGGVAALPDGVTAQIQESVLAGLWRVRFTDARRRVARRLHRGRSDPRGGARGLPGRRGRHLVSARRRRTR